MTTPKVGGLTPKVAGMTPKVSGLTPGPVNFGFSPAVNINSPAAFATQRRGHLQIGSPANFPLTFTPNTAAAAEMVASMGFGQGIARTPASFGLSLPPDENKKKELEDILRTLALKPGRISMEGVERLAKRLRLDFWQEAKDTGGQTVSITGAIIVVDIDFMGNNITQVVLSFANTLGTSNDLAPQAAAILKKNLQPNKPLLISDLSDFANNLERLSKLDKISTAHSLNCFTAITGLYGSLLNIFEYEKGERVMEGGAVDALCKGNGRPRMHCNGKVGLSVEYWRERRKMLSSGKGKERDVMMGGTGDQEADEDAGDGKDKGRTWRIIIEIDEVGPECTSLDAVRTSEDWVGKGIAKPSDDSMFGDDDFIIDWLDPEPSVENLMEVDSARPNARFIARLDPPIIVPLLEEVTIFSSLGLYSPPGQIGATTLDGLLFPRAVVPDPPPFTTERIIHLPPAMDPQNREHSDISAVTHKYTLHTLKPIYAREVWEIPFGHPRQLGPILHIFRQYVLLATLLRSCFSLDYISSGTTTATATNTKTKPTNPKQSNHQQQPPPFLSHINPSNPFTLDDLDSFLASTSPSQLDSITATTTTTAITSPPSNSGPIPIDISLSSDPPSPTLKVIFPSKITYQRIISLEIEVSRNAILTARYTVVDSPEQVARNGGVEAGMGKGGLPGEEAVMKAVENTEDVGIVVEWLRRMV